MWWWLALACQRPVADETAAPTTGGTTATPTAVDSGVVTDTARPRDTARPVDSGDTGVAVDCAVLPPLPVTYDTLQGWGTAEDFDFDGAGYHVSVQQGNLFGRDRYGAVSILAVGFSSFTAGTRVLSTGDWVVADANNGALILVDAATGGQSVVSSGVSYPNGVETDRLGYAFVADNGTGQVRQVDPYSAQNWPVASGLTSSNGLILSPDEQTLYVGSFGAGKVWAVPRLTDTTWGPATVLWETSGIDGGFDGINVDVCGNVYITEYIQGKVWRVTPDGLHGDLVVDLPSSWIPNMRWGNDVGGWSSDILYVSDRDQGRLFALHMGIAGKKHVLTP